MSDARITYEGCDCVTTYAMLKCIHGNPPAESNFIRPSDWTPPPTGAPDAEAVDYAAAKEWAIRLLARHLKWPDDPARVNAACAIIERDRAHLALIAERDKWKAESNNNHECLQDAGRHIVEITRRAEAAEARLRDATARQA